MYDYKIFLLLPNFKLTGRRFWTSIPVWEGWIPSLKLYLKKIDNKLSIIYTTHFDTLWVSDLILKTLPRRIIYAQYINFSQLLIFLLLLQTIIKNFAMVLWWFYSKYSRGGIWDLLCCFITYKMVHYLDNYSHKKSYSMNKVVSHPIFNNLDVEHIRKFSNLRSDS